MSWSIERFERDLLSGRIDTIAVPSGEILEALDRVQSVLGSEWIASKGSAKGLGPAMHIFGTGLRLASLEGVDKTEELIHKLRHNDPSADAELTAIHLFRSNNRYVEIELYPPIRSKVADFRIRQQSEEWTTVEVTQAGNSNERERINGILVRLVDAFRHVEFAFSLEVIFLREPKEKEIALLCKGLPEFCQRSGQERQSLLDGLGFLLLNHATVGHLPSSEVPYIATAPMIGLAAFFSRDRVVSVKIPFADTRAEAFLKKEARQLPKNGPGLIMIAGISSTNEMEVWKPLIERRFRPSIHTRVSGVCLYEGGMVPMGNLYSWQIQARIVSNPHAKTPLPDWINTVIASADEPFQQ